MQLVFRHLQRYFVPLILSLSGAAQGAVSLTIGDGDATPTLTTAGRGATFPIVVKLFSSSASTADSVLGIDYFLKGSTSGIFTLVSRSTGVSAPDGVSAFPGTYGTDAAVGASILNPQNGTDLGGTVNDVSAPVGNGTFEVADFVLSVSPTAPIGVYTVSVTDNGVGYVTGAAQTGAFAPFVPFTVTVTPEPATLALCACLPLLAARRRV